MAGWRRAVELAMSDKIFDLDDAFAVEDRTGEPGVAAQMLLAYRNNPSFCAVGQRLGVHHQTVQRCVERRWSMARWRPRRRPRPAEPTSRLSQAWLVSLACDRPRTTAIHMSCGRRGFWRAMRASWADGGACVFGQFGPGTVCKILGQEESSRTRCVTILKIATPSSSRRWRRSCASIVSPSPEESLCQRKRRGKPVTIVSCDEKPDPGHRNDGAGFAAQNWHPCYLCARP